MFVFVYKERGAKAKRRFGAVAGLSLTLSALAGAQVSETDPDLYDLSTATVEFAARASLEFNPPTRSNVWILGSSSELAQEPVRATNPWASIFGQPQAFELDYNVDTGDISWSILGTTLTANHLLTPGQGLYYIAPLLKVETPDGAANNTAQFTNFTVAVNGGGGTNFGSFLSASGTQAASEIAFFTQYDVHNVNIKGELTFNVPDAWPTDVNGMYADIELVSAAPVPEPASIGALTIGIAAALRRRKSKKA